MKRCRGKWALGLLFVACAAQGAGEADLPPLADVRQSLQQHVTVLNAASFLRQEYANQRKWNSGNYEFNVSVGTGQRQVILTREKLREWFVDIQRPVRWLNKVDLDTQIGEAAVMHAEFARRSAWHDAARLLLRNWFVWQRERIASDLWQQQVDILSKQADMSEIRLKKGDAPRLELNQAKAAVAQAHVALQQAQMREQLAANDLTRQFVGLHLPTQVQRLSPQSLAKNLPYWQALVFQHSDELAMTDAQARLQQLLAQRSRADTTPDPTLGFRVGRDLGGSERTLGVYVNVPISFGVRSATADAVEQQAIMAADQAAFVKRRLEGDVQGGYTQAVRSFNTWQQARDAAVAIRSNADMVSKAYAQGESSLSESLTARRLALESSLAEQIAALDANEARYRLLLDTHQLWEEDENDARSISIASP